MSLLLSGCCLLPVVLLLVLLLLLLELGLQHSLASALVKCFSAENVGSPDTSDRFNGVAVEVGVLEVEVTV